MKGSIKILMVSIVFIQGCSSPKYLSTPKDFQNNVKGLYFKCQYENKYSKITGEIIEVSDNHIKLLPIQNATHMITIDKNAIDKAEIMVSLSVDNPDKINTWASLMNLTSIGHGFWGVFTLPVNVSVTAGINSKNVYWMKYPEHVTWDQLHKFARFPQGIPKTIDETRIK